MTEISRRTFIQLSMLSAASGLAAGCGVPEKTREQMAGQYGGTNNHILPYLNQPDGLDDGVAQWFATTCRMCPAGCGLIVRTMGGRAIKVEGKPDHPVNRGKTCARGQASLQQLYNPQRLRYPVQREGRAALDVSWEIALAGLSTRIQGHRGRIAILADGMSYGQSPTISKLLAGFAESIGATLSYYSLLDSAPWRAAAKTVYGRHAIPLYAIDQADYLLAFNSNFLEAWPSPVYYARAFGEFRQGSRRKSGDHGRLVYVGPRMSMTAAKADRWLPCRPGTEAAVALGVLTALGKPGLPIADAAAISGVTAQQIVQMGHEFQSAGTRAIALAGDGLVAQPNATEAIMAVESLNAVAKSGLAGFGSSEFPVAIPSDSYYAELSRLQTSIKNGSIDVLLIVGQPNPVFSAPIASGFVEALRRVPFIAAITPFEDETTAFANLVLPTGTFLEEWSDCVPEAIPAGVTVTGICQPVVDTKYILATNSNSSTPWMQPRPVADLLADISRRIGSSITSPPPSPLKGERVRPLSPPILGEGEETATGAMSVPEGIVKSNWALSDTDWEESAGAGGKWSATSATPVTTVSHRIPSYTGPREPIAADTYRLLLYPHIYWTDGRNARLPWLQEIPDPMTMAVWNNWVEINAQTAHKLGIRTGDIVRITTDYGAVELPALPSQAIHPEALAVPIGQGLYDFGNGQTNGHAVPNPLGILAPATDSVTGALAYGWTSVRMAKVRDAVSGYYPELNTLVVLEDRPGGQEPEAVMNLIHTTAREKAS